MKKILYVASSYGHILSFHIPYITALQEKGYIVDIAASNASPLIKKSFTKNTVGSHLIDMPFEKKMFSLGNLRCTKRLLTLIVNEQYDIVSAHTSLAAFFVRLAVMLAFSCKKARPTVINTVHGYLFDTQTPFLKRLLLLGAEKLTKPATNHLLVMNNEDYGIAERHHLYKDSLSMIPGMGIDTKRFSISNFSNLDHTAERFKFGFQAEDIVMIYAAEFSTRKNQKMLIAAMEMLPDNVKLILAGQGEQLEECKALAADLKLGITSSISSLELEEKTSSRIIFAGHVKNLEYYYYISDICVSSSRSEGLPFNIMEAMAMGLPVIATKVKGHVDLVKEGENGLLYDFNSIEGFIRRVLELLEVSPTQLEQISTRNAKKAKSYSIVNVLEKILTVYD